MFCRSCGKEVNPKAIACPGCGVPPLECHAHCQECGAATTEQQVMCTACGCKLRGKAALPTGDVRPVQAMGTGEAVLWVLCCYPVGYVKLNQGMKALIWFVILLFSGGLGYVPLLVDYFMCNAKAERTGTLGEYEFFPRT